jgi:hypothetical protein
MRRWILFACLILIPALGAVVPAAAQASTGNCTAVPVQLKSEQSCPLSIPEKDATTGFFFYVTTAPPENGTAASQAAAHVTLQVSNYGFGGGSTVNLELYEGPNDTTLYTPPSSPSSHCNVAPIVIQKVTKTLPYFSGNNFCSFDLPAGTNGWWYAALVPQGSATGSLTMTYAANVTLGELSPTVAVGATIPVAGQWAGTTFDATGGDQVKISASSYDSVDGQVFLELYEPNGSFYGTPPPGGYYFTGNGPPAYTITLPAGSSGLWSAFLEPDGPAGAMLTLTISG